MSPRRSALPAGPDLPHRFAAGDPDALREAFDLYSGAVLTVALSRLRDRGLAEEAVQDTFLKAWRAAATFDPQRDLRPWLYEIARRAAADIARRERRRPVTTPLAPASALAVEGTTLDDAWTAWQVRLVLDSLPADERELLHLTHDVGLTQSQVAAHTGLPLGTVKSRLHRAHHRLTPLLAHLHPDP